METLEKGREMVDTNEEVRELTPLEQRLWSKLDKQCEENSRTGNLLTLGSFVVGGLLGAIIGYAVSASM